MGREKEMIRLEDFLFYICFCVGISSCVDTNRVRFARYLEQENRNDDRFTLSSSSAASPDECAVLCRSSPDCESFFFRQSDGSCELKTVLYINQTDTSDDQGAAYYYEIKDAWCPSTKGYVSDSSETLCLRFHSENLTWFDAKDICSIETLSSRLVVINDEAKLQQVQDIVLSEGMTGDTFFLDTQEISYLYTLWERSSLAFTPIWLTLGWYNVSELCEYIDTDARFSAPCNFTQKFICELTSDKNDYDKIMTL